MNAPGIMRKLGALRGSIALVVLGTASLTTGCAYNVRMARPEHVGDRFGVTATGRSVETQVVTLDGAVGQQIESKMDLELTAAAEVLAIDSKAQAIRMSYRIEKSRATVDGASHEILPAGTTVVVEDRGGRGAFEVDGAPVAEPTNRELDLLLSARAADAATEDEMFGTAEPRKVGDSWLVNAKTAADDLSTTLAGNIPERDITGTVRLVAVRTEAGVKCLEVEGHMEVKAIPLPMPVGFTVESASGAVSFWGLFPSDVTAKHRVADKQSMTMSLRARGRNTDGKTIVQEIEHQQSVSRRIDAAAK